MGKATAFLSAPWRWWCGLFTRRETGEALALCRVAAGLCLLLSVGTVAAHGLVGVLWVDAAHGGYRELGPGPLLTRPFGGPGPAAAWFFTALAAAAGVALTLGLWARAAALVGLVAFNTLTGLNPHDGSAYDSLLTNQLWLLVFAASGATWSLGCRITNGHWTSDNPVSSWPRYLMIGQLVVCYSATGMQKISAHWVLGGEHSAIYYILQEPLWQRWDMSWLAHPAAYKLTQLATALAWTWETHAALLFLVFYYRDTAGRDGFVRSLFNRWDLRTLWALFGLAFHLGIELTMRVGPFTWITLAFYPALWHPDEYRRGLERLRGRLRGPSRG